MPRRKLHKRSRQKPKYHKIPKEKSFRENVRSKFFDWKNGNKKESDTRSPESVLFESHPTDPLCGDGFSPDFIPKHSKTKSEDLNDNSKINDRIIARMVEQSSPISSKGREVDFPTCDFKHNTTKCISDFPNLQDSEKRERDATESNNDPFDLKESFLFSLPSLSNESNNNANGTVVGRFSMKTVDETPRRNISESAISRPDLGSQSRDDMRIFANVLGPANSDETESLGVRSNRRKDHYILETMDDYYLDKTQSMNDNYAHELDNYLDEESTMIADKLKEDRVSERPHFEISRKTERDEPRDGPKRKKRGGGKRFDVAFEKIGARLTANWREFQKIFGYLWRENRRTHSESLHRYKKFPFVSTLSTFSTPSSSPRRMNHDEARESEGTKREVERTGIPPESTTPRIGLTKRCRRMTLTFAAEDEDEDEDKEKEEAICRHRQPASREDIKDSLPEGKKDQGCSFLPDSRFSSFSNETRPNGRILESTIASDVELSDRDDHGDYPQKVYKSYFYTLKEEDFNSKKRKVSI